jgi:hypothetical protein
MKKIALLIGIVILSMNVFGQKAGERYVSPCFSASFGVTNYKYYRYNTLYNVTEWSNVYISPSVEFGKFLTDKVRFGFSIGNPFTYFIEDNSWMCGLLLSPNFGFYVPITDRFSYAPEIGVAGEVGFYDGRLYYQAMAYANLLVFEFRVKENISIAMHMGEIGYCYTRLFGSNAKTHQLYYNFNSGLISVRFYY